MKNKLLNLSLAYKLFLTIFFSVLVIGAVVLAGLAAIYKNMQQENITMATKTLSLYTDMMDLNLAFLKEQSASVMTASDLQRYLQILRQRDAEPLDRVVSKRLLGESLFNYASQNELIQRIDVFGNQGEQYSSSDTPALIQSDQFPSEIVNNAGGCTWFLCPTQPNLIGCARLIRSTASDNFGDTLGTLVFWIDLQQLTEINRFQATYYNSVLLLSQDNEIFYQAQSAASDLVTNLPSAKNVQTIDGITYLVCQRASMINRWSYYLLIPQNELLQTITHVVQVFSIVFLAVLGVLLAVTARISKSITQPLTLLSAALPTLSDEQLLLPPALRVYCQRTDEVGQIYDSFFSTTQRLEQLFNENYKTKLLMREAQLSSLQAQIDPHFLYNALDCINWQAKMNKQDQISTIARSLAVLLRSAIHCENHYSSLQNELELVEHYISIQKIRFGNRLVFRQDVDAETLHIHMPKLLLQPLIENSIKYAVESSEMPCLVALHVHAYTHAHTSGIEVAVEDEGPGMSESQIQFALSGLAKTNGNGVGLFNVDARIRLQYGGDGLRIANRLGGGLRVSFLIPKEENGHET